MKLKRYENREWTVRFNFIGFNWLYLVKDKNKTIRQIVRHTVNVLLGSYNNIANGWNLQTLFSRQTW